MKVAYRTHHWGPYVLPRPFRGLLIRRALEYPNIDQVSSLNPPRQTFHLTMRYLVRPWRDHPNEDAV